MTGKNQSFANTSEDLQYPALNSRRTDVGAGAGYQSLEVSLEICRSLEWFPIINQLDCLDECSGIALTLQNYEAK